RARCRALLFVWHESSWSEVCSNRILSVWAPTDSSGGSIMTNPWTPPLGAALVGLTLSDGWTDPRQLAVLNVQGGWTDSVAVTRDGRLIMFSYSMYDYSIWKNTGAEVVTGPSRLGQGPHFKNFLYDVVNNTLGLLPCQPLGPTMTATSPAINSD